MKTKIRVLKNKSDSYQISLVDDTGFQNQYNLDGYKPSPDMTSYVFEVLDEVGRDVHVFEETDVEPYQNGVVKTLELEDKFKDSLYKVTMYSVFDVQGSGDGFEGLDFISNVSGAETIANNYSAIKVGDYVYKIVGQVRDMLLLDRTIKEDFEEFELAIYSEDKVSLLTGVEERIIGLIGGLGKCKCGGSKRVSKIAELQLYMYGIRESVEQGNYEMAKDLMKLLKDITRQTGGCNVC